jgi:hypothetical protein
VEYQRFEKLQRGRNVRTLVVGSVQYQEGTLDSRLYVTQCVKGIADSDSGVRAQSSFGSNQVIFFALSQFLSVACQSPWHRQRPPTAQVIDDNNK